MLKMNKLTVVTLIFCLCFSATSFLGIRSFADPQEEGIVHEYDDQYQVSHRVIHQPYLDIEVWVDRGEGATYYPGEEIKVYFRASRDCYVVIYNIDTRGYVGLLYPYDEYDDYYVEGGRTYRIPDRFDDYDLTVDGPEGTEYIQAVASFEPISVPNFPGLYEYDEEIYAYCLDGEDPFEFMEAVNEEIVAGDYASDVCIFNVEYEHPRWYYWPREVYVGRPVDLVWGGVYIDYPWGVEVWIDGVFYGITPITIPALVVGRHWFSFWYRGCWIWRDWYWIRRDHTVRIWADCDYRYRWVRERFVEKSYRAEKAKRRRGIDERGGFVRPFDFRTKERLAVAEKPRVGETSKHKKELRAIKKGEVVKYKDEKSRVEEKRLNTKEIKSQIQAKEQKRIIKSTKKGLQIKEKRQKAKDSQSQLRTKEKRKIVKSKSRSLQIKQKREVKKKDRLSKGEQQSSKVKSIQRHETKKSQSVMKKSSRPKAQTKSITRSTTTRSVKQSTKAQTEHRKRR